MALARLPRKARRLMQARIAYDHARQLYVVYIGREDMAVAYDSADLDRKVFRIDRGEEAPPFLKLYDEEYMAIRDAILLRETPVAADKALLREAWDDARETRDRLLVMLEEG